MAGSSGSPVPSRSKTCAAWPFALGANPWVSAGRAASSPSPSRQDRGRAFGHPSRLYALALREGGARARIAVGPDPRPLARASRSLRRAPPSRRRARMKWCTVLHGGKSWGRSRRARQLRTTWMPASRISRRGWTHGRSVAAGAGGWGWMVSRSPSERPVRHALLTPGILPGRHLRPPYRSVSGSVLEGPRRKARLVLCLLPPVLDISRVAPSGALRGDGSWRGSCTRLESGCLLPRRSR